MESIKVTVANRGYIVLPAFLRKEMGIGPGTKMLIRRDNDKLILQAMPSFTEKLAGLTGQSIAVTAEDVDNYIDTERKDRMK
jgi:AbrB family looped-hinge helix DNA binding protein